MILAPLFPCDLPPTPTTLTGRFAASIEGLLRVIYNCAPKDPAALAILTLLWPRLLRSIGRFERLVARARAALANGATLLPPRRRAARPLARPVAPPPDPSGPAARKLRLPGNLGWLADMMGEYRHLVAGFGSGIADLLNDPEMPALLAAAPPLARLLRPLCRMGCVDPLPALLHLPPRARRPRIPSPAAPPSQTSRTQSRLPALDVSHAERLGVPLSPALASMPSSLSIPGLPKRRATRN